MNIEFEKFTIINFDKGDDKHLKVYEELVNGKSQSKMISMIKENLLRSHKSEELVFDNAYLLKQNEDIIGYLYLTAKVNNHIYLEMSILKDYRNKRMGSMMLEEITNYLFINNDDLKEIRLSIDKSNPGSMKSALNANYYYDEDDYMNDKIDFICSNPYYINRKK